MLPGRWGWLWIAGLVVGAHLLLLVGHLAFADVARSAAPGAPHHPLDFNQEGTLPTYWSAIVFGSAGVLALASRGGPGWLLAGGALLWVALEESFLHLHEDIQVGTGADWPLLYAPLLAVGARILLVVARDLGDTGRKLLLAGLACMAAAVCAELLSSPSIALDFQTRNLVEENLELAGTGLVLCAFASWLWPASPRTRGLGESR
jgi:hypothetical protein